MASIFSGHVSNGNAAKLTREQKQQIKEVLSQPPSLYGLPGEFWCVPTLKDYLQVQLDVVCEPAESYQRSAKTSSAPKEATELVQVSMGTSSTATPFSTAAACTVTESRRKVRVGQSKISTKVPIGYN